jgi:REP element-mobilizing transposase RayT
MTLSRKNIRLSREIYETRTQMFSITICTWNRHRFFELDGYAKRVVSSLETGPFGNETERFAYCLMPDHLHLLVAPGSGNLVDLISGWKRFTGGCLKRAGLDGPFWQRGFFDHALRREEDVRRVAEYIVHNPVRAGLTGRWRDYPYSWHRWM